MIYVKSPGGVEATAQRTLGFEDDIKEAAKRHGVDPDTLAALIFLESAGRVDIVAGKTPDAAVGLGQILPGTATDLLGMKVDLERSKQLTRSIARNLHRSATSLDAEKRSSAARAAVKAQIERRKIDERFDPKKAIDGAARYLELAKERFGREDLAAASYHMGIGNLESLIDTYVSPRPARGSTADDRQGLRDHLAAALLRLLPRPKSRHRPQAQELRRRLAPLPLQDRGGQEDPAPLSRRQG